MFSFLKKCRICSSDELKTYLSLGSMPLANNLVEPQSQEQDLFFPLEVCLCNKCFLSQLTVIVKPEILFSNYYYMTSVSATFKQHFQELGKVAKSFFPDTKNPLVLDIASNDGCLLLEFKKKGFETLGVEPAKNLVKIAEEAGIHTIPEFWSETAVKKILKNGKKPNIVTATNVFAHVSDVHDFIKNVKRVMSNDGIFIVEVPHALNLVQKNQFDTIYHEHLSYFLVKPLLTLFSMEGMEVFDVENISTHGGSIRVFVKFPQNKNIPTKSDKIGQFVKEEEKNNLYDKEEYGKFADRVMQSKIDFLQLLLNLKKTGKVVAGYGAAAKASTLLNYCGAGTNLVNYIVDDSPLKQGKAFAGNRIPIYPSKVMQKSKPDYLILFAWTIARELMSKTRDLQPKIKYVIPLPSPKIVSNENDL